MSLRKFTVAVTTASDGTATAYSPYLSGFVHTIQYVKAGSGNFADGVDFTITVAGTGETVWTESNVNASAVRAPRQPVHSTAGVASLYAAGGTEVQDRVAISRDRVKIVIGSGGDTKTGTFVIIVES